MTIREVLLPLFVEVVLTFVLLFWTASSRTRAFASGKVAARDIALREPNWPPETTKVANAYHNQLELPILFYVLTILAWNTRHADYLFIVLAWIFVVLRIVQAYVHVTSNNVRQRGLSFILGAIILAIMWGIYVVEIVVGF